MNKPTVIIKTLTNEAYGIEVTVAEISNGFSVAVKDTDAGEYFPCATIYQTKEQAIAAAEKAAA